MREPTATGQYLKDLRAERYIRNLEDKLEEVKSENYRLRAENKRFEDTLARAAQFTPIFLEII